MTANRSELEPQAQDGQDLDVLGLAYRLIADCFVYPEELDRQQFVDNATARVVPDIASHLDDEAAVFLATFLDEFEGISASEYVQTLELSPACPLYLGHYEFDDPKTCREIAGADRNQYMVELAGIYEHFGFKLDNELPDFVPAMVEFLWLTRAERNDGLRDEFLSKMASMLPGMVDRFEAVGTPYQWSLKALERVILVDMETGSGGDD